MSYLINSVPPLTTNLISYFNFLKLICKIKRCCWLKTMLFKEMTHLWKVLKFTFSVTSLMIFTNKNLFLQNVTPTLCCYFVEKMKGFSLIILRQKWVKMIHHEVLIDEYNLCYQTKCVFSNDPICRRSIKICFQICL